MNKGAESLPADSGVKDVNVHRFLWGAWGRALHRDLSQCLMVLMICFCRCEADTLRLDWWQEFCCWRSQTRAGIWAGSLTQLEVKQLVVLWKMKEKCTPCISALILLWNLKKCELPALPKNDLNSMLKSRVCQHNKGRHVKACMEVVMFVPHFSFLYFKSVSKKNQKKIQPLPTIVLHFACPYFTAFYKRRSLCCSGNLGLHQNEINWSRSEHKVGVCWLSPSFHPAVFFGLFFSFSCKFKHS